MTSKIEFSVQMTCNNCVEAVKRTLAGVEGVASFSVDLAKQQVVVETSLPALNVQHLLLRSGRKVVLQGYGNTSGTLGLSSVAMLSGSSSVIGVVRFAQLGQNTCVIDGTIDGLAPGEHGLHVHELGDISNGCLSVGGHFNPFNKKHGGRTDAERHVGDLGNITADENGRATFKFEDHLLNVPDIIGRSLVVTAKNDDLGKGPSERSFIDGNAGEGLACGIIARSAGIYENAKRICQCDGISIWDETQQTSQKL